MSGDNAPCGVIFDRYREFSALAKRLEVDETSLGTEMHSQELEALWERRSQLARELVDTPAPAISDVSIQDDDRVFLCCRKRGAVGLGLTQQCVEECERALPVETVGEQSSWRLSPRYGVHAQQILQSLVAAAAEDFEFSEAWWDEVREGVRATACHQARTPLGLRAESRDLPARSGVSPRKPRCGARCRCLYMRDFGALAAARLRDEGW